MNSGMSLMRPVHVSDRLDLLPLECHFCRQFHGLLTTAVDFDVG